MSAGSARSPRGSGRADQPDRLTRGTTGEFHLHVRDGGPPGGETVLLLHGFPQDGTSWSLVAPLLHDAGLRTLVPDQRGYAP